MPFRSLIESKDNTSNENDNTSKDDEHSSSTKKKLMVIDCTESIGSSNSSSNNVNPTICVIPVKKMMTEDRYRTWLECNTPEENPKHITNGITKLAAAESYTNRCTPSLHNDQIDVLQRPLNGKNHLRWNLIIIEKLYKKYFSISVEDTVVVIANILNILSMSYMHLKTRIYESAKKRSEAEKLKERCDANRFHDKHRKILETKLMDNFIDVISSFAGSDFDVLFQMFFLCNLSVIQVLDQPKKKGEIFKNLQNLLWNSLKNSEYENSKIISMLRSRTFRFDCINLLSLIEESLNIDSGVTGRMPLFFVSTTYSRDYFQEAIDAVTCNSYKDLELIINNAIYRYRIHSKFKDYVGPSTVQRSNGKTLVTETIWSPINSDKTIQKIIRAKYPDGTFQIIPMQNVHNSQTVDNKAVESLIVTSQSLNNLNESFASSIQNKTSESSTSKLIPTKKCFVTMPTVSNSSLVQVTASSLETTTSTPTASFMTFKPSIENTKSHISLHGIELYSTTKHIN